MGRVGCVYELMLCNHASLGAEDDCDPNSNDGFLSLHLKSLVRPGHTL